MSGTRRYRLRTAAFGGIVALAVLTFAVSAGAHSSPGFGTSRGPSSATDPYVLPVAKGVHTKALLTVGDAGAAGNGFEMVGIPDGLGARRTGGNDLFLYMNHELNTTLSEPIVIIDTTALFGADTWLSDVQAHLPTTPPGGPTVTVEDGQLFVMRPR